MRDSTELPKYRQIYNYLKDSIAEGQYRTGQRLPSESELGKTFAASRLTVNRALRELQLAGLIERRVGSGSYVSATAAAGLTFGLLIPELGVTEIFEPICRGMAEVQLSDHHVLLWGKSPSDSQSVETRAQELCQQWIAKRVSGVFFAPLELSGDKESINRRISELFQQAGIPLVLIDRDLVPFPQRSRYDLVGIDNRRAAYLLTNHLVELGCKRLVFVSKPRAAPTVLARAAGFREAVQEAGLPFTSDWTRMSADPSDQDEVREMVRIQRPDGIVCANDYTAAQLMRTLESISIHVPDDIRMGGFDDVKYASLLSVPLTTIHQPCAELGASAVRAMVDRLNNPTLPARDLLLDFRLVIRESSVGASLANPARAEQSLQSI